jgi:3-phenylpropionate/trans-cinnamate dioxygenase ferredoxin subunit
MPWYTACTVHDLAEGQCHHADVGGEDVLLTLVDGDVHAVSNICTHDYAELSDGELDGAEVVCPLHMARFDVRTGEVTAPPAYEALRVFPVRVTDDGNVEVEVED